MEFIYFQYLGAVTESSDSYFNFYIIYNFPIELESYLPSPTL